MPRVSILMCVYNGETYLEQAIDSILAQTYQDFELILVNDGSRDNTLNIIDDYTAKDNRVINVSNPVNLGLEISLNKGLALARGEYFARQDADDLSLPTRLEKQVDFLDNHPQVGALGTAVTVIDSDNKFKGNKYLPTQHQQLKSLLLLNNFMHHSTLMARTEIIHQVGGYREDIRYVEDYDLWWKISQVSKLSCLSNIYLHRRMANSDRVSLLNRKQQLENTCNLSLACIQDSWLNASSNLDQEAFRRFWWSCLRLLDRNSYEKIWLEPNQETAKLTHQDLKNLNPFWSFLKSFPEAVPTWSPHFRRTAFDLAYRDFTLAGPYLWWITNSLNTY